MTQRRKTRPAKAPPARKARAAARPRDTARDQARDVYRTAILEAAARVFARAGFFECKVIDIAREAGLAAGTLYNYFDSKEQIFQTLCHFRGQQALAKVRELTAQEAEPLKRLERHVAWILSHIEENVATFHVYVQLGATTEWQLRQVGGEDAHDNYRAQLALLEATMRDAQEGRTLRHDVSARELTLALAGTVNAFIHEWIVAPEPRPPLTSFQPRIMTLFLQGASPR